jgi:quercetin dioxygenase-like cupin family protein
LSGGVAYTRGPTVLGDLLLYRGLARVPVSTSAVFAGVVPVRSLVPAWALLAEAILWTHVVGVASVLLRIGLTCAAGEAPPSAAAAPVLRNEPISPYEEAAARSSRAMATSIGGIAMKVVRGGEVEAEPGTTFTGEARLARLLAAQRPGGVAVSLVRFEDGARTKWHAHPGEQILYILEGEGRVGTEADETRLMPGDVVYAAPGERHWHGALPGRSMAHLSVTTVGSPQWFEAPE